MSGLGVEYRLGCRVEILGFLKFLGILEFLCNFLDFFFIIYMYIYFL